MEQNNPRKKNYKFALALLKLLQPVFGILFYTAIFFIVLCLILSVILLFVNVQVDQMLLPPFMHKIDIIDAAGEMKVGEFYNISFGNGIKITTAAENIALDDIKVILFAGLIVLISALLTIAPVFKFLSMLLKNINSGEYEKIIDEKNPRYVMFIGLCVFIGTILIRFVMRFYNYYLAARFIKCAPQEIKLALGIDVLSGITGLTILFIGFIFAYIFRRMNNKE